MQPRADTEPPADGEVLVEYVGGKRCGQRHHAPIVVRVGESAATAKTPADTLPGLGPNEVYLRRPAHGAQRCRIDAVEVWHYDFERPVRRVRPANEAG